MPVTNLLPPRPRSQRMMQRTTCEAPRTPHPAGQLWIFITFWHLQIGLDCVLGCVALRSWLNYHNAFLLGSILTTAMRLLETSSAGRCQMCMKLMLINLRVACLMTA